MQVLPRLASSNVGTGAEVVPAVAQFHMSCGGWVAKEPSASRRAPRATDPRYESLIPSSLCSASFAHSTAD